MRSRFFKLLHVLFGKPASTFPGHALRHVRYCGRSRISSALALFIDHDLK